MVTSLIVWLLTWIPHDLGTKAVASILAQIKGYSHFILTLKFVLTKNYLLFQDQFYFQIVGTPMGSNVEPTYAVIFMNHCENQLVYPTHCIVNIVYYIYDDIFLLWQGISESLIFFSRIIERFSTHNQGRP